MPNPVSEAQGYQFFRRHLKKEIKAACISCGKIRKSVSDISQLSNFKLGELDRLENKISINQRLLNQFDIKKEKVEPEVIETSNPVIANLKKFGHKLFLFL